jgi:uridine phosphorylase
MSRHLPVEHIDAHRWLLPGDPGRVDRIAEQLDHVHERGQAREFRIVEGSYHDVMVGVCSTGIGAPSTAIAVEELASFGATHMIRVGTTGALDPSLEIGDLCVAIGAVRHDGTSDRYLPPEYPAVPDLELTHALLQSNGSARGGLCVSSSAFYREDQDYPDHALNVEMEAAALFIVAQIRGVKAASICAVSDIVGKGMLAYEAGIDAAITAALEAISQ